MRLYGISLANFRSFEGKVEVPFGPVTSLIGPSGAGKSNILLGLERIADLLSGGTYKPGPDDYFDNNHNAEMQLGATLELSDGERRALLARTAGSQSSGGQSHATYAPFRFVRYLVAFRGPTKEREELSLSTGRAAFHPFARARLGRDGYLVDHTDMEGIDLRDTDMASPVPYGTLNAVSVEGLAEMVDPLLFPAMLRLCGSLRTVVPGGGIPSTVPALGGAAIGTDGQNLPNEISHLQEPERIAFNEYMEAVTHGDPRGIEPRAVGHNMALLAREDGLLRRAHHGDLGSGQHQTLILGWHLFRGQDRILVIKDPELYLHAERQRQIFHLIWDKSRRTGAQFVIETRSPAFLGGGRGERTVLVSKDTGRSDAAEMGPGDAPVIRRMLGVTHADALDSDNILLVEGKSEHVSFGAFLGRIAPEQARRTTIHNLEGASNIKNVELLVKYLENTEGHRAFVILDENRDARLHIAKLKSRGMLRTNVHFLPKNFEDAFDDGIIAAAIEKMAGELGVRLVLAADEVSRLRIRKKDMASGLAERWQLATSHNFDKVRLAKLLVSLVGGHPPPDIKRALESAVAHFESNDRGGAKSVRHGWAIGRS